MVHTSDKMYAGTDNDVYINIKGTNGETGDILLDKNNRNDFERNQKDEFQIPALALGLI